MTAYKDNKPATVTSGGRVIVEFKDDTAEVSEELGGILRQAGYRVEDANDADGAVEDADTADNGQGRGVSSGNGKKRN